MSVVRKASCRLIEPLLLLLVCLVGLRAPCVLADRHVGPVEVMRGTIIAEVTINGKVKANLIVDTGAGPALVITSRLAQQIRDLEATSKPSEGLENSDPKPGEASLGPGPPKVETLQWGEITARDISPMALDLGFITERTGVEIDGIIGVGLFGKYITTFDCQGEKVILDDTVDRKSVTSELAAAGADVIPYEIITLDKKIVLPLRIADSAEERFFILDTGASKLGIFQKTFEALAPASEKWPKLEGLDVATVMGEHPASVVRVPKITLSRSTAEDVDCTVCDNPLAGPLSLLAGRDVAGLLGYSFLKRFKLTIDYEDEKVYLVAYDRYREKYPDEYKTIGAGLRLKGGRKVAENIVPGSPAEQAGFEPGDVVLEIDGRRADDMTLEECRLCLEGEPGTMVRVTVLRNGKEVESEVPRKKLL